MLFIDSIKSKTPSIIEKIGQPDNVPFCPYVCLSWNISMSYLNLDLPGFDQTLGPYRLRMEIIY